MDLDGIIAFFEANRASPKDLAGLARYGIKTDNAYGVRIPALRALAKRVRPNHALALELWATGIHDACNLAPMIDDPAKVSRAQMNRWARDFDSWDICDNCCNNLFRKTKFAHNAAVTWAGDERTFVRRAGFALMAVLAVARQGRAEPAVPRLAPLDRAARGRRAQLRQEGGQLGAAADRQAQPGAPQGGGEMRRAARQARFEIGALDRPRRAP